MTPMESKPLTKPPLEKMRPFEWLYWAFLEAGMEREAEGMQWALMSLRGALAEANWQANRRVDVEQQRDDLLNVVELVLVGINHGYDLEMERSRIEDVFTRCKPGTGGTATKGHNA